MTISLASRATAPWVMGVAVLSGQAMAVLDTAIVNVGAPQIQHDLGLSGNALQLAVSAYVLTYAVGLITGARLGARHGYARVFGWGTVLFTLGSLACGLAADLPVLVAARTVQGAGAALLVPQVLSLLQVGFHGAARRRALSIYGTVLAAGVVGGQILGGVLVSADLLGMGWRPIFLVNVPVGLVVLALLAGRPPSVPDAAAEQGRLDLIGAGLLTVSILAIVVPLTFAAAARHLWWWPVLGAGAGGLVLFRRYERRIAAQPGHRPLLDPGFLRPREVRHGLAALFVLNASYAGLLFTTALYVQYTLHQSALRSGLTFVAYAAGFAIASPSWSRLPAAWHPRIPRFAFAAFAVASLGLAVTLRSGGWPPLASGLLAVMGAGAGTGFGALVRRCVECTAPRYAASLSGVLATTTQLAIAMGIATLGTLYFSVSAHPALLPAPSWTLLAIAAASGLTAVVLRPSAQTRQAVHGASRRTLSEHRVTSARRHGRPGNSRIP